MATITKEQEEWLRQNHLEHWIGPCNRLLEIFDGIERIQERPSDRPEAVVASVISKVAKISPSDRARRNQVLHDALIGAPVFRYRGRLGDVLWNPLEKTLAEFEGDQEAIFWEKTTPHPSAAEIERWIEEQLAQP